MSRLLAIVRERQAVAWLVTLTLAVMGVFFARSMPSAIYPEVEFPRIVVVARTGGAPADVFVTNVTRPLEGALASVLGVQDIKSKTIRGATNISLQFAPGTDMWRALGLVESRVNEARAVLPPQTELVVEQVTTGSFPIVTFNLSGHADPRELRELGDLVVRPAMAGVAGVGRVEVLGGDVREVEIVLDPEQTAALHLTPEGIAALLRTGMGLKAVGRVERDRQLVTVVADALPHAADDLRGMPIGVAPSGAAILLEDIADVIEGAEDRLVRIGGPRGQTVVISVARMPGASTTDVVAGVTAVARDLSTSLPPGVTLTPVYDQAELVRDSMANVRDAIVLGIALCALVIGLFLRDARVGLLAGVAVPLTLAITFVAMKLTNQTLNLMSLGGMAVSIGLVVDDVIVIVEAIARKRDEGMSPREASIAGTSELAPAVIGTTLTTVVVFVPLGFLSGVVGDFFRALAFTLTAAVLVSLAVSIVIVPLAASRFMGKHATQEKTDRLATQYARAASWLARRPVLAVASLAALIALGAFAAPGLQRGFLPELDEGAFVLDYFLPEGTSVETTEKFARTIENELARTPEVRTFSRRLGAELGPAAATQLNRGDIMVGLVPRSERKRDTNAIIDDLRARIVEGSPEVRLEFIQVLQDVLNDLAGSPHPLEVKVFGPDYAKLHEIANGISQKIEHVPGLVDLFNGEERDAPELSLALRREAIASYGLTPDDVSLRLEGMLFGVHVGSIRRFDRLVNVRVRYPNPVRFDPSRVKDVPISIHDGRTTTLEAIADTELRASPSVLLHEALQPVVVVTGDHKDRDIGSLSNEVEAVARTVAVGSGYRVVMGGQVEGERTAMRDVVGVAALAALLVLSVLAGQFKRLKLAALTLLAIPAAIVGAILALRVSGTPLNASSLMGMVLLVGLVVKNGVLLLEAAERARDDDGESAADAVRHAAERRLRPVLMTTLATLAGLFPLALGLGAGAELQRPLAIAVMGGLITSTIATLGLMPPVAALGLRRQQP